VIENLDKRTWGSSLRAGVLGAVLVGLPAYFLMVIDALPAVQSHGGVFVLLGRLVVVGTIVTGLALVTQKRTRRFGLGLLLGSVVTWVLCSVAMLALVLHCFASGPCY
jgi:hypothetical protein